MKRPSRPDSDSDSDRVRRRFREELRRGRAGAEAPDKFLGSPARIVAEVSAAALANNYRAILDQVPDHSILPMIKADAYGHGAAWAATRLAGLPGLYALGVATLGEGAEVREALGPRGRRTRVIVFSGATPWSDEKGNYCEEHGLTPVLASDPDWNRFVKGGWPGRIPYELKFNTGMNRLGMNPAIAPQIARALSNRPPEEHPTGILTHLAIGEEPEAPLSRQQRERFAALRAELGSALPAAHFHLANSAGIWNQKAFGLRGFTDVVRPGISLYGVPPWPGAPARGLLPVMTVKASVLQIQRLKAGQSLGYGATFKSTASDEPVYAAWLGAGYADGVSRALSNGGHAWLRGKATRFIGRVSMDLCAVRGTGATRPGDWVELIGPHIDPWAQAKAAGTIPYELLTSVSQRVQRSHGD